MSDKTPIEIYRALSRPPEWALKQIKAGRLAGKTDISPQWRYEAMTEAFGLCGEGWYFEIVKLWTEPAPENQVFAFAQVNVYLKQGSEWSVPIPGIGGNMLVAKERNGLYANDEAYKMAITDALSTALKMIGVGADIYAGAWDGSKYIRNEADPPLTDKQKSQIIDLLQEAEADEEKFCQFLGVSSVDNITQSLAKKAVTALEAKLKQKKVANGGNND